MKKEKIIEIIRLDAKGIPFWEEVENELSTFQKIVDGYIEVVMIPVVVSGDYTEVCCIINEEGKLLELDPNFAYPLGGNYWDVICGNVVFCGEFMGEEGKEFRSLNDEEFVGVLHFLQRGRMALDKIIEKEVVKKGEN